MDNVNGLERITVVEPAYDRRHEDPDKNYGIHGCNLRFVLKGPDGAVQFLVFTGWHLRSVDGSTWQARDMEPMAADLGYHSYMPTYHDQQNMGPCEYLNGEPCYYDGSSLNAEPVFERMLTGGSDAVWKDLEEYYQQVFGDKDE